MKIRSVTCLITPVQSADSPWQKNVKDFVNTALEVFTRVGFNVQTTRMATPPFSTWLTKDAPDSLAQKTAELEGIVNSLGINYLSLGPALPTRLEDFQQVPPAIAASSSVFFAGSLITEDGMISLSAVKAAAQVIASASSISEDGFANLRFAALANVSPGGAFFPAAYHTGGKPAFTLATEAADLVVQAFSGAKSLDQARRRLIESIEAKAGALTTAAEEIEKSTGMRFWGIDFTPAPFPDEQVSVANALEQLGIQAFGGHGSLAASAFLVDSLDRAKFRRTGFNGLMLPVLEDAVLAERGAEGILTVKDLLLYSTVCGTGLDTVPIPGDTTVGQISAILLDIAALSQRLNKPLTARLMPVPGLRAGDRVEYDFPYFANSRVLALDAQPLSGLLAGEEEFSIQPSPHH